MGTRSMTAVAVAFALTSCHSAAVGPRPHTADGTIAETTDSAFVADVLGSGRPAVVYYKAFGCIPCISLGPHVKRLAARYAGRVTFWTLDMGWSAARVRRYDVPAVPSLVFYSDQQEIVRQEGMPVPATDDSLERFVEEGLKAATPP